MPGHTTQSYMLCHWKDKKWNRMTEKSFSNEKYQQQQTPINAQIYSHRDIFMKMNAILNFTKFYKMKS